MKSLSSSASSSVAAASASVAAASVSSSGAASSSVASAGAASSSGASACVSSALGAVSAALWLLPQPAAAESYALQGNGAEVPVPQPEKDAPAGVSGNVDAVPQ